MKSIHKGIKYKVEESHFGSRLYTWFPPTKEYVFERTLQHSQTAEQAIDQLIEDGFLKPIT